MNRYNKSMRLVFCIMFLMINRSFGMDAPVIEQFQKIVKNSKSFFQVVAGGMPTKANSVAVLGEDLAAQEKIIDHCKVATILVHDKVLRTCVHFLEHKRKSGTDTEKNLYKEMTVPQFVERLITCRPIVFYKDSSAYYQYVFRDGARPRTKDVTQLSNFQNNAKTLADYISRDEIEISASIGIISPTLFINSGDRYNCGQINHKNQAYQKEGFFAGLVGACLEAKGWLEYKYMVITPDQNTADKGYGLGACNTGMLAVHSKLYDDLRFPTYDEAKKDTTGRFVPIENGYLFDKTVYEKCIDLRVLPFLQNVQEQVQQIKKKGYVHVVGLGLGVWQMDDQQIGWMVDVYTKMINENDLSGISDINFSWVEDADNKYKKQFDVAKERIIDVGKAKKIIIHFSKRNPSEELVGEDKDKVLFVINAWDGGSCMGNEYALGGDCLKASGDSAAACCSTIAEVQNPWINPYLRGNIIKTVSSIMDLAGISDPAVSKAIVPIGSSEDDSDNEPLDRFKQPGKDDSNDRMKKALTGMEAALKNLDTRVPEGVVDKKPTPASWNNRLVVVAGGISFLAAMIYYFRGEIFAHWSNNAKPKL